MDLIPSLVLVGVGLAVALKSKKTAGAVKDSGRAPGTGAGSATDLCSNDARRRDQTNAHGRVDLVDVESYGGPEKLHPEAARAFRALLVAARAAGFKSPLFAVASGYRTLETQTRLFASQVGKQQQRHPTWTAAQIQAEARRWVALPGHSDHETGCAIDFWLGHGIAASSNDAIRATAAFAWLEANASTYGFCPYSVEAWHWKYILEDIR